MDPSRSGTLVKSTLDLKGAYYIKCAFFLLDVPESFCAVIKIWRLNEFLQFLCPHFH
jgi:hypothetical protein